MKKSLVAISILGAVSSAASAQANVTIYGVADAGISYDRGVYAEDSTWRLQGSQQSGSRIGVKGTENLGGGLSASFVLENGLNLDNGLMAQGGRLFGRQAWVGLSGDFGTVRLGRQGTPLFDAIDHVDPFETGLAGNAQPVFGYGTYDADPLLRSDNILSYATPDLHGLSVQASYGFGEQAGNNSARRQLGFGMRYATGPLSVHFAYHDANTTALPASAAALGGGTVDLRTAFVGGTYDLGVARIHLAFADTDTDSALGRTNNRNWLAGVSAPVGSGTLLASYIRNDIRDIDEGTSDQYAVGYTLPLSKRTNLYTSYSHTRNDGAVRLNAWANGKDGDLFNVGIRHRF